MAQRGRGGMMQRGGPMRGGMIRGRGGVMLSRGGIKRPLQGHTGPRPSFQYRDGSFICDLCKKSFSDGNDMVSSSRLAIYKCKKYVHYGPSIIYSPRKDFQLLWENFFWKLKFEGVFPLFKGNVPTEARGLSKGSFQGVFPVTELTQH